MNILLIEDDNRISDFVIKGLEENNFSVTLAVTGEIGREMVSQRVWDLILMDVMLPGIDGTQLTKLIRFKKNYTPILVISALDDLEDKTTLLDSGADDYLVKPFHFRELISRINALIRRTKFHYQEKGAVYLCENLNVNLDEQMVYKDGSLVNLSPTEYKLLLLLLENKNKVVSRTQILNTVWGIDYDNHTNVVDVYISYLRNKIDTSNKKIIHTIKGRGYMLKEA